MASPNGREEPSPATTGARADAAASATRSTSGSMPTTRMPRSAMWDVQNPWPQPRSSTGPSPASRSSQPSTNGLSPGPPPSWT
ncbi:MAG TPA: hypothetical protein VM390_09040, partial [Acidimicrobiales bacterium]|nr:hypothetical protein [Acidimicrobiales bacterium]